MIINGSMWRTGISYGKSRMNQGINTKNAANVNKYGGWMNASPGMGGSNDTGVSAAKSAAEKRRMLSRD